VKSLKTYLEKLQDVIPDQLVRVDEAVDWQYEITAIVDEVEREAGNPALLFERIKGYSRPLLINLFGHVDRMILALEGGTLTRGSRLDFYRGWNSLITRKIPPTYVDNGPVKDVRRMGGEVDLASLPIPRFYEQDGGRYITAGLLVARDPDRPDDVNLSYARMRLSGKDGFGVSLHSRGHLWHYYERSKSLGRPLDVAIIIGAHPALYLVAAAKIINEYHVAGAFLGEPLELVGCETVDLPVPAQSEIVLEGQILLDEGDEGPFTEYTGYISGRSTRNVIKVSAMTMRRDATFMAVAPSNSSEHLLLSGLPKQARISQAMIDFLPAPALNDIIWPVSGTHFANFVSLKRPMASAPGLAKQSALLLLGLDHYVKIAAVLTEDVDISDSAEVFGAIASRCDLKPGSGLEILKKVFSQWLDPSSPEAGLSSKMMADATGPSQHDPRPVTETDVKNVSGSAKVTRASFPLSNNRDLCVVQVKPETHDLKEVFASAQDKPRLTILVDDDVDIEDFRQVLWALATRFQPAEDIVSLDGGLMLDARKPRDWKANRATVPKSTRVLARKICKGFIK